MSLNERSLDTLCAALCAVMGVEPPACAAAPCKELVDYAKNALGGKTADRIVMYNPDAVAQWIYEKYPQLMKEVIAETDLRLPLRTVMPSVTPVCFGTMYTGAQPETHGIQAYVKPVIRIDTIFDALVRAGKRAAILSTAGDSLSLIYLERPIDYFIYDTVEEINAKAAELILADEYDFLVIYNTNYDYQMHRSGPEGLEALAELRANSETFAMFNALIKNHWKCHNTLLGFAMDHGCHAIDGGCGSHGLAMDEDLNIVHLYKAYPAGSAAAPKL